MLGEQIGRVTVELSTRETGDKIAVLDENGKQKVDAKTGKGLTEYEFPTIKQNVTFDFTACSDAQIRELLTSTSPTVRYQSWAREQGTQWMKDNPVYVFDVATECSGRRVTGASKDPIAAFTKAASKMDADTLRAQIATIEKMLATK